MPRTSDAKERLILAAVELIWETSYGLVSVDAICERAGVKKGSFYHFFETKDHLTLTALEQEWEDFRKRMDACFSPLYGPLERFEKLHELAMAEQITQLKKVGRVCGCPIFSLGCELGTQDSPLRRKIAEIMAAERKYYESAIRDAVAAKLIPPCDPAMKAGLLQAYLSGAITHGRILNSLDPLHEVVAGVPQILGVSG